MWHHGTRSGLGTIKLGFQTPPPPPPTPLQLCDLLVVLAWSAFLNFLSLSLLNYEMWSLGGLADEITLVHSTGSSPQRQSRNGSPHFLLVLNSSSSIKNISAETCGRGNVFSPGEGCTPTGDLVPRVCFHIPSLQLPPLRQLTQLHVLRGACLCPDPRWLDV